MINVFKLCILPKSQNQPFAGGNTSQKTNVLWKTTHWGEAKPWHSLWRIYVQRASRETEFFFWSSIAQAEKHAALGRKAQIASRSVCCAPREFGCAGVGFSSWSVGGVSLSPHTESVSPACLLKSCLQPEVNSCGPPMNWGIFFLRVFWCNQLLTGKTCSKHFCSRTACRSWTKPQCCASSGEL